MIGRTKAVKHKGKEREGWDKDFAEMDSMPSREKLGSLLRRLLHFYSPVPSIQGDNSRLTRLAIWLLDHTKEGRMQLLRGDYDSQSSLRCRRLCLLVLSRLRKAKCDNDSVVDAALLLKMCDAVTWGDGGVDFAAMLVGKLVEQGLMSVAKAHFLVKDDAKPEQLMVLVCGLVARSLGIGCGEQNQEIWRQYVLEVLCSLHVSKHVSKRCKEMLEFKGVWSSLLAILSAETGLIDQVFARGVDPAGFLLSNLVEMSSERLSDSTPSETGLLDPDSVKRLHTCNSQILLKIFREMFGFFFSPPALSLSLSLSLSRTHTNATSVTFQCHSPSTLLDPISFQSPVATCCVIALVN